MTYIHDHKDHNLSGSQKALEYNIAGEPALRVIGNANGYGIQVADGDVPGVSYVEQTGVNLAVDVNKETIWDGGGIYSYLEAPDYVVVTSDSPNDVITGTGARSVKIDGLNVSGEPITETVLLGGTSIKLFSRIHLAKVVTSGSSGVNEGIISITSVGAQVSVDVDVSTSTVKTDLIVLYNDLYNLAATVSGPSVTRPASFSNETLTPGVYDITGAGNITGTLTLDAGGNELAIFIIRCSGAFTTAASAEILLTGGAVCSNVWIVSEGASSTGANTIIRGNLLANQGAVSTGAGTQIVGGLFAITGAISVSSTTITAPTRDGDGYPNEGFLLHFSMFSGNGNITNTSPSSIALNIGTNVGVITGFALGEVIGSTLLPGDTFTATIISNDTAIILALIGRDGTGNQSGRGQTFMSLYTIPTGKTGYITQWTVGGGVQSSDCVATMMIRNPKTIGDRSWNSRDIIIVGATTFAKNYVIPLRVEENNDIEVRAYSTSSTAVSSSFCILVVDNPIV
jgi:hypothetical protein